MQKILKIILDKNLFNLSNLLYPGSDTGSCLFSARFMRANKQPLRMLAKTKKYYHTFKCFPKKYFCKVLLFENN
jgi:hypothetical protein